MAGLSLLGAIGFTMSLLIAGLSFDGNPELLESAKRSVLAGSLGAGILAYAVLRWTGKRATESRS
jgi:NhaA family Na+:H+ antiporter